MVRERGRITLILKELGHDAITYQIKRVGFRGAVQTLVPNPNDWLWRVDLVRSRRARKHARKREPRYTNCRLPGGHNRGLFPCRLHWRIKLCQRRWKRHCSDLSASWVKRHASQRDHGRDGGRERVEKRAAPRAWSAA